MSIERLREHGCKVEKVFTSEGHVYLVSRWNASVIATARCIEHDCDRVLWSLCGDEEDEE